MDEQLSVESLILLMQKAKQGDKESFATLYRYYFLPIFRYALKRVGNEKEAEDVTQVVFLKVFTSGRSFSDTHTNPLAYFFTVARTVIIDRYKKLVPTEALSEEIEIKAELVEVQHKVELKMTLDSALHKLPDEQQQVVKMKFHEGLSTAEIALRLGKTEMAVRQIQCRALKVLKQYID